MAHKGLVCLRVMHVLFVLIMTVLGALLLGFSIYGLTHGNLDQYKLTYTGKTFWDSILRITIVGIVLGSVILAACLLAMFAMMRNTCGKVFAVFYDVILVLLVLGLLFIGTILLIFATNNDPPGLHSYFADSWAKSVDISNPAVCEIQTTLNCLGINSGDCANCNPVTNATASCTAYQNLVCPNYCNPQTPAYDYNGWKSWGCYPAAVEKLQPIFLPVGIVSVVLAAFGIGDAFLVCFL